MNNSELKSFILKHNIKINGVIHVGAHFGQEDDVYEELKIQNRLYFEPLPSAFDKLKEKIKNEHLIYNKALGNENKFIKMFVETKNQGMSSSILEPSIHLRQFPEITFDDEINVEMIRLDDLNIDLSKYNMMNIDVQGYELEVLKGSEKTLKNIEYIIVEINNNEMYKNCVFFPELESFLKNQNFICVEQFWWGGTFGEGFFVKKN
jgi:FkbM family methyltransferase